MIKIPGFLKEQYKSAKEKSWEVTVTKNSHLKWKAPNGRVVITASTTSCRRGGMNDVVRLRKALEK